MKKSIIYISLSIVVILSAVVLLTTQRNSTIDNQFYIADTSNVSKIFLTDKDNNSVLLQKQPGGWLVNNEFEAIEENVDLLLKTMLRIEIKHLYNKSATQSALKQLITNHTKVEIYQQKGLFHIFGKDFFVRERKTKVYFVGGPTPDNKGTLMKLENNDQLYVTHLPGMNGYLSERYSSIPEDWKSHLLYNYGVNEIKEIELELPETPDQAYKIINNLDRTFQLIQSSDQSLVTRYDTLKLLQMVASFGNINYELVLNDVPEKRIDSILNSQPYRVLKLTTVDGEKRELSMYHRKNFEGLLDLDGEPFPYDVDRMYAFRKGSREALSVQFFVMDEITRPLGYFAPQALPDSLRQE